MPDDFVPRIDPDLRDEMFRRVVERVTLAWKATEQRRRDFAAYEEQVRGVPSNPGDGPWPDSCQLCDTLTMQESLTLCANIQQALNAHQIATCEPTSPGDEDAARDFELWANAAFFAGGGRRHLEDVNQYAVNRRVAFSVVSWRDQAQKVRGYQYLAPDGTAVRADERQEDIDYREEPVLETIVEEGLEFRAPEPADVFTDPPNYPDIQRARGVGEHMLITPEDLLDGIQTLGYDEETVHNILFGGATAPGDTAEEDSVAGVVVSQTGIETESRSDGPHEIVQWIGRIPLWYDGDLEEIPLQDLQGEDFLFVIHVASGRVLKWASWRYGRRPYVRWNMRRVPNSLDGLCLPQMLESVQEELNAQVRSTIDTANMETVPAMYYPEEHVMRFGYPQLKPGGGITYSPQSGRPEPVVWDKNNILVDVQLTQALRMLGKEVSTAQFSQQPLPGDTTATEVSALYGGLNAKFDLYLNTMLSSVEDLVLLMAEIASYHAPEAGLAIMVDKAQQVTVQGDVLRKRYRIQPYATSDQANPQLRLQKAMLKQQVQEKYLLAVMQLMPVAPQFLPMIWHGARASLMALGEREVEAWIGPEPPPAEQILMMQQQAQQQQALMGQAQGAIAGLQGQQMPGSPNPPPKAMAQNGAQP